MASIARALRVARPLAFSNLRSVPKPSFRPLQRTFVTSRPALIKRYTMDHEWIDVHPDKGTGVVGISEYAAEQLGDVVYVELPDVGTDIAGGDALGAVESVKSASDINAPVACRVTHVNTILEEKPGTLNKLPEDDSGGGGWIARVEVGEEGLKQLEDLMDYDAYKAFTEADSEEEGGGDH